MPAAPSGPLGCESAICWTRDGPICPEAVGLLFLRSLFPYGALRSVEWPRANLSLINLVCPARIIEPFQSGLAFRVDHMS